MSMELPPIIITPNPPPPPPPPRPQPPVAKPLPWNGKFPANGQYADFFNKVYLHHPDYSMTVIMTVTQAYKGIEQQYLDYIPQLSADVDAEVMAAVGDSPKDGLERFRAEKKAVDSLVEQSEKLSNEKLVEASAFFGRNVLAKGIKDNALDFLNKYFHTKPGLGGDCYRRWEASAQAAFQAKILEEKIRILKAKSVALSGSITKAEEDQRKAAELIKAANTFQARGLTAASEPVMMTARGTAVVINNSVAVLQAAIRASITAISGFAASTASGLLVGVTALVYSPKLGNGELPERYSFSTPLSELAPGLDSKELEAVAAAGGTVSLPVRLSSKTSIDGQSELIVVKSDNVLVSSKVRVIAASYDAARHLYSISTGDVPSRTLTWTPIVDPGNGSTTSPVDRPQPPVYTGASVTPINGRIDSYPGIVEAGFNDFITVFPADSGIPPIYVMFRDPREDAGTATGVGQPVSGVWLGAASQGVGAPVPTHIADQLRGKQYENFREFREELWEAVASDPVLATQFNAANLARMKAGAAAKARKADSVGGRTSFEIHHVTRIADGGAVYDIDNMRIVTPKRHIDIHSGVE